jgi:hypothetical protein
VRGKVRLCMEKETKGLAEKRKRKAWRRKGNEECRVVKQPKKIEKEKTVS